MRYHSYTVSRLFTIFFTENLKISHGLPPGMDDLPAIHSRLPILEDDHHGLHVFLVGRRKVLEGAVVGQSGRGHRLADALRGSVELLA